MLRAPPFRSMLREDKAYQLIVPSGHTTMTEQKFPNEGKLGIGGKPYWRKIPSMNQLCFPNSFLSLIFEELIMPFLTLDKNFNRVGFRAPLVISSKAVAFKISFSYCVNMDHITFIKNLCFLVY